MGRVLIAGTAALLICIFLSPKFIEFLREREFGQQIREEGPQEHHAKAGTPTMGGIIIFTAIAVPFLLLTDRDARSLAVFGVAAACALLGFADDYTKLVKRRSLGLKGRTKLIVTLLIAVGLWLVATRAADLPDTLNLRIVDAQIDLGYLYPLFIYLVVAGTTSAVNLTDLDLAIFGAALVGAAIGFLWYNAFPAEVFMGDTGSMAFGGALASLAIMTRRHTELLLLLIGGIFVIEALSVMIQVFAFKYLKRRVFLMAPIHHHFEMKAWSETKIMVRFWIVTGILCAAGFALYYRYYFGQR